MATIGTEQGRGRGARELLRAWKLCKRASHYLRRPVAADQQKILFILGCQRSGTTLATRIFERDWNARVFDEFSELSSDDARAGIRLNAFDKVENALRLQPYSLLVAKPLVESQRAPEILRHFRNGSVLWLYRSYIDVAASDLAKFGERNGIDNIRHIVEGARDNWRAQNVAPDVRATLAAHFRDDMNPMDAAALFWYSRNRHFFDAKLDRSPYSERTMLLRYERLTNDATGTMQSVYRLIGRPYPGPRIVAEVDPVSVGRGSRRRSDVSDGVREICESLLTRLDAAAGYSPRSAGQERQETES